jgi:hypothetical protein
MSKIYVTYKGQAFSVERNANTTTVEVSGTFRGETFDHWDMWLNPSNWGRDTYPRRVQKAMDKILQRTEKVPKDPLADVKQYFAPTPDFTDVTADVATTTTTTPTFTLPYIPVDRDKRS